MTDDKSFKAMRRHIKRDEVGVGQNREYSRMVSNPDKG